MIYKHEDSFWNLNRAVSSLFGPGETARKTLIEAWLDEGIAYLGSSSAAATRASTQTMLARALHIRLGYKFPDESVSSIWSDSETNDEMINEEPGVHDLSSGPLRK